MPSVSLLNDQFSHDFQYVLALTRYEFCWKIIRCTLHGARAHSDGPRLGRSGGGALLRGTPTRRRTSGGELGPAGGTEAHAMRPPGVAYRPGRSTSPRQAPVSWPRASINSLKHSRSFATRRETTPSMSPRFSTTPCGSYSIWSITRVLVSERRWNVTTPALVAPVVFFQATRSSGCCSVMTASHSSTLPPILARQWRRCWSSWRTASTPSINRGNSSNCVH